MTVACYTRISTPDQNPQLQLRELREYAQRQGWELAEVYQDVASGAKGKRPGLTALMEGAREGKFTCVLVWKLDRFGRSLVDCLNNIRELENHGVRFIAVTQGQDGLSLRQIARCLVVYHLEHGIGLGTVSRTLQERSKGDYPLNERSRGAS